VNVLELSNTWLPPCTNYGDCIYIDGLLYAIISFGEINVFDLTQPIVTANIIMRVNPTLFDGDTSYIVQGPSGDLLHIRRSETDEDNYDPDPEADPMTFVRHTGKIEIYKIDISTKTVVETNCLHRHVLFLGHNQTLCLHAEEYPSLKANHAYFTDDSEPWLWSYKYNRRDIGVFNMGNNIWEELISPKLWSNWPTPVWITPNLTTMYYRGNK
jgi:hypothetical protein